MFPNRDPRLPNAILNSPDNFLTRLADHELRLEQLEVQSTPPIEEIIGGRLTIADLILSPAEGVLIADPTSTDYTGSFMAGEGILFDSVYYVFGNVVNGELKTGFTDAGTLYAIDAEISGTVVVGAGSAGGWLINSTQIYSLASDIGIILDSSVPIIRVGNTAGDHIVIDGANQRIRSSNFVTGVTGLNLDTATGDAEFNNIVARGEMKTFLFTSQNQMAVAGNIMVSKDAGKLGADAASGDTTVDFGKSMTVGDWIKIQGPDAAGSAHTEWMLVGSLVSGTTYNVTRDVDGTGANNWLKDSPFVVIGAEGDGRIELVAGASASLQLITQGATWNSQTVQTSMSTVDGAIVAGGGSVLISNSGIVILESGSGAAFLSFYDAAGIVQQYAIKEGTTSLETQSLLQGGALVHSLTLTDASTPYIQWRENPSVVNQTLWEVFPGAAGGRAAFGYDHFIDFLNAAGTGSATVYFNERGKDIDLVVKDDAGTVAFQVDAAAHTVSVYGTPISGSGGGYAVQASAAQFSPGDGTTRFVGSVPAQVPATTGGQVRVYLEAGTLSSVYINWNAVTVAGSGEDISAYVRLNDTTDTLIQTVGDTNAIKIFSNTGLSIAVNDGDYIEIKFVFPTWATNPTDIRIGASVFVVS